MNSLWMKFTIALLALGVLFAAPLSAASQSTLEVTGSGTYESNCLTLVLGCTITSTGQMTGTPVLPGQFILRFDTGGPNSLNGYPGVINQGVCLPASFGGRLTETGGDSIDFAHAGFVCEEAATGSPFVFYGTFRVIGGTGRFASATGGGSVVGTFTRDAAVAFVYLRGAISY